MNQPPFNPSPQTPPKKPFKFHSSMVVVPMVVCIAVGLFLQTNSKDIGGTCWQSDWCKKGLDCISSTCMKACWKDPKACPEGFRCEKLHITMSGQNLSADLGNQAYCVK